LESQLLQSSDIVVVAGSSIAGMSAARELRARGFKGQLVMLDRDQRAPYRRPEVSKGLLNGVVSDHKVVIPWPDTLGVRRIPGAELTGLDHGHRTVTASTANGDVELEYSGLIIATGSEPRRSPFPPMAGVHSLRTFGDSERFRSELAEAQRVVIVGAGFIGLEVAYVASAMGKSVTVIEPQDLPLAHILGTEMSTALLRVHKSHGVRFHLGCQVEALEAGTDGHVERALVAGGTEIEADIVLVAIGSVPSVGWLRDSGLAVEHGVPCDANCAVVGAEDVVAAGDVALWRNPLYGRLMRVEHWAHAIEQGTYAARRLLGVHDPAGFAAAPYFWSQQYGQRIQSIGSTTGSDHIEVLDPRPEHLLVAYFLGGRLTAVAGLAAGPAIFTFRPLILNGADIESVLDHQDATPARVA
jgi:NADPH-dependent 2,4-dienoyl-CoA reductase/sulfur reductase-like enzyme